MEKFELKEDHLLLLERAHFYWDDGEYGAPAIDCKRPYGNSDVLNDIAEILGREPKRCPHCHETIDDTTDEERDMDKLHRETLIALQVITQARSLDPGVYVRVKENEYSEGRWQKLEDVKT